MTDKNGVKSVKGLKKKWSTQLTSFEELRTAVFALRDKGKQLYNNFVALNELYTHVFRLYVLYRNSHRSDTSHESKFYEQLKIFTQCYYLVDDQFHLFLTGQVVFEYMEKFLQEGKYVCKDKFTNFTFADNDYGQKKCPLYLLSIDGYKYFHSKVMNFKDDKAAFLKQNQVSQLLMHFSTAYLLRFLLECDSFCQRAKRTVLKLNLLMQQQNLNNKLKHTNNTTQMLEEKLMIGDLPQGLCISNSVN